MHEIKRAPPPVWFKGEGPRVVTLVLCGETAACSLLVGGKTDAKRAARRSKQRVFVAQLMWRLAAMAWKMPQKCEVRTSVPAVKHLRGTSWAPLVGSAPKTMAAILVSASRSRKTELTSSVIVGMQTSLL